MTGWGVFTHGLTLQIAMIAGVVLTAIIVTLLRQRRSPGSSVAWLLAIVLLPPIGIPAFLLLGGQRFRKISATKATIPTAAIGEPPTDGWSEAGAKFASGYGLAAPTGGNRLRLHPDGETAFADVLQMIDSAKRSIAVEMYILKNDATGKILIDKLAEKAKAGVEVRVLLDGLGSFSMSRLAIWRLRRAGVKTAFFLPVWRIALLARTNLRNHRKIVIVDGERVFAGGRNLATEYLGPTPDAKRWRDLSFVLEGPAVAEYARIFRYDWAFVTREQLAEAPAPAPISNGPGGVMQVVPAGPDVAEDALYAATLSALYQAQSRIWIVTPYFVPDDSLRQALVIAAKRGVDVRIIVPEKPDQLLTGLARGPYLRDVAKAGAKVRLLNGTLVHAKAVLVDDAVAMVGSANFDARSMFLNFEVMSLLYSSGEIKTVEAWIETLWPQTAEGGKPVSGFRDTLESLAYLVAPQL